MGCNNSSLFQSNCCCSDNQNENNITKNEITIYNKPQPNLKYINQIHQDDDRSLKEIMLTYELLKNQKSQSTCFLTNSKNRNRSISLDQKFYINKEVLKNNNKIQKFNNYNQTRSQSALTVIEIYQREQSKIKLNGILKNRSKTQLSTNKKQRKLQVTFLN